MTISTAQGDTSEQPIVEQFAEIPNRKVDYFHRQKYLFLLGLLITLLFVGGYYYLNNRTAANPDSSDKNQPVLVTDSPVVNQPKPSTLNATPQTSQTNKNIYLYPAYGADPSISINTLHVVITLFAPKDINTPIKNEWFNNMEQVGATIKTFFENEFDNTISISYEILKDPILGDLDISSYTPTSMTLEVQQKTNSYVKENSHTVWMIYLVRDPEFKKNIIGGNLGGLPQYAAATQFEYWLDNETFNSTGLLGSLHEFGHVLGIPHPWELPTNISGDPNFGNVPGDLMGYSNKGINLIDLYIREDVKKTMGL